MADFPTRHYAQGDVIFHEGSLASVAYILKRGSIEISVLRQGQKIVLAILKPGAIFGEMALILSEHQRTASATTLEDSEVIVIYKNSFYKYLAESSIVIRALIDGLIERLYNTTSMLIETDNLWQGICQILRLFSLHENWLLDYETTVKRLAMTFQVDPDIIREKIAQMENSNLLELTTAPNDHKMIKIKENIIYIDNLKEEGIK